MTPALLTHRLLLRPLEHEDAHGLVQLYNDPSVARGMCSVPLPFTALHASAHILMQRAGEMRGQDFVWAIENSDGDLIGEIGVRAAGAGKANLGYAIARQQWGQGYATEAIEAVVKWAEKSGNFASLSAEGHNDSPAVVRLMEKLGFVKTVATHRFSLSHRDAVPTGVFVRALQTIGERLLA